MLNRERLVPLIVGGPIFMQNLDSTAMAIAIPSMSASLQISPLYLNLAITSYLLSLAAFLPLSAWMADRFGARRMFLFAIVFFSFGSALSGTAQSLGILVLYRVLQGFGAALMLPVGRLIMLRNVDRSRLVTATLWFTVPGVVGRMSGPMIGGAIVTYASWHWIFFLNIPVGLLLMALTASFVQDTEQPKDRHPFDWTGFILLAAGMVALMVSFESISKPFMSRPAAWTTAAIGAVLLLTYIRSSGNNDQPVVDLKLLKFKVLSSNVFGAMPLRIAIGGAPFLLPLMLQLGLGLTPLQTGALTMGNALGALLTRLVLKSISATFKDMRRLLMAATFFTGAVFICCAFFSHKTPWSVIFGLMMLSGLFTSICLVSLNSVAFFGLPDDRMSHATALLAMAQQLSAGLGVAVASTVLLTSTAWHGDATASTQTGDYAVAFVALGLICWLSILSFRGLPRDMNANLK